MKRRDAALFGAFLILLWAGLGTVLLARGGLYIANHEGDTVHLIDMILRQADGQWIHLDFMTPLGLLAIAPIVLFVKLGYGVGTAILAAQVLVAAVLLPAIWWVGVSRLRLGWAIVLGAICLLLAMALVHGGSTPLDSVSMHYNRWAWAVSFLAVATVLLPPLRWKSEVADGLLLGAAVAALALLKVTYVVAFLPPILAGLVLKRQWLALKVATGVGLAVILIVTVLAGPGYWIAYVGDLWSVAQKAERAYPGATFVGVIAAPEFLGGSFLAILSVIFLRQSGRAHEGLMLLLCLPGFVYVTYQNYGNDPQWLFLLGVLLLCLRPEPGVKSPLGWDLRYALTIAGCMAFAFELPSAINLAYSPFRHLTTKPEDYTRLLPRLPGHDDIFQLAAHEKHPSGNLRVPLAGADPAPLDEDDEDARPAVLLGETLPDCKLDKGMITVIDAIAQELEAAGHSGKAIYQVDLQGSLWLFGDFAPVPGAAPWWYADLPGLEAADLVLLPLCPLSTRARASILTELEAGGYGLREVERTENYVLLELQLPTAAPNAR